LPWSFAGHELKNPYAPAPELNANTGVVTVIEWTDRLRQQLPCFFLLLSSGSELVAHLRFGERIGRVLVRLARDAYSILDQAIDEMTGFFCSG